MDKLPLPEINNSLLEMIGNTPLLELKNIDVGVCRLFVKMESQNPGGSIKDRVALSIIEQAEKDGLLKPGGTIVEATAGNTGIGLALVGVLKGYKVILVIPDKMSREKILHLKAIGTEIIFTRSDVSKEDPEYYHNIAEKIVNETPGAFYANQFGNPANAKAHEETTGPEIWEQMNHDVDAFVAGVGSGGTLSGVGKFFKNVSPSTQIVAADPEGSIIFDAVKKGTFSYEGGSWFVEGIGEDFIPDVLDLSYIDDAVTIPDSKAFDTLDLLLKKEGILAGSSAGTLVAGAIEWCKAQKEPKRVVSLICDTGNKYLSKAFDDAWLSNNGLSVRNLRNDLSDIVVMRSDKQQIVSVKENDTVLIAYNRMRNSDFSQLPVLDNDKLIGTINENDILNYCGENKDGFSHSIDRAMSDNLHKIDCKSSIDDLSSLLNKDSFAMIMEGETFIGIVTKVDLLAYLKNNN
ncbi:pyridoxal-phosphate dependent enzyme [Rhodobiaceae bacterium]|jgi:cystathionine beta-synthase|nr:pyridoxal-phosphate dependent enzyme [Rhodobiaceae bacterium]